MNNTKNPIHFLTKIQDMILGGSASSKSVNDNSLAVFAQKYATITIIVMTFIFFAVLTPTFGSVENLILLSRQISILSLVGCAMTIVIIAGEFDLSLGAITIFSAALVAKIQGEGYGFTVAVLTTVIAGFSLGAVNGLAVARLRIPSIIITLATRFVFIGFMLLVSGSGPLLKNISPHFLWLTGGYLWLLPVPTIIMIVIYFIAHIILTKTKAGYALYATGYDSGIARSMGIRVMLAKWLAFAFAGGLASLAGILLCSRAGYFSPTNTDVYLLESLAVAFIGMNTLREGEANVLGTFFAVILFGVLANGMNAIGFSFPLQQATQGFVFILAVAFAAWARKIRT
jgi:ribose transport system permease protein